MSLLGAGRRRGCLVAVLMLVLAWPAAAQARLSWSGPVFLNEAGLAGLTGVACASPDQCTAVDYLGKQVTFNPTAPKHWSAYEIDSRALNAVSCPSVTECVAVDGHGREATFDPRRIGTPHVHRVDSGEALESVACPSVSECTTSDSAGGVVTFDPASPGGALRTSLSSAELGGVACPGISQCTVIVTGYTSGGLPAGPARFVTFDPAAPTADVKSVTVVGLGGRLACPTMTECVAAGGPTTCSGSSCDYGGTMTFNPTSATVPTFTGRDQLNLLSIACPSATQCTAMDMAGYESTFDPTLSAKSGRTFIDPYGDFPKGLNGSEIACSSASECTAVASTPPGSHEMTFNPMAPRTPAGVPIDTGAPAVGVSCPTAGECVTLAQFTNPYLPYPFGTSVSIDPRSPSSGGDRWTFGGPPTGLSCPASTQCTMVIGRGRDCFGSCQFRAGGLEETFNPRRRQPPRFVRARSIDGRSLTGISCPSLTECVAIDTVGRAIIFNPRRSSRRADRQLSSTALTAVDCVSTTECVTTDRGGQEISINPMAKPGPTAVRIDARRIITGLTCPSAHQCTAVDRAGFQITFNPNGGTVLVRHRIASQSIAGVSCTSAISCVAISSKRALTGNPQSGRSWNRHALAGASTLTAIACRPHGGCVVVDAAGHAYIRRRS